VIAKKKAEGHPLGGFAAHQSCCSTRSPTFREGHCKVTLPSADGIWICLSGTAYQREHLFQDKLADLLYALRNPQGEILSSPLELKGGGVDVSHVQKQLQSGANIITDMLTGVKNVKFLPVLVLKTMSETERRTLHKHKISFRGRAYGIMTLKSGGSVGDLPW
jgi:hypothetical protein